MNQILPEPATANPPATPPGVRPLRLSRAEYHQLGELGWFLTRRVQLVDGQVFLISTQSSPHAVVTHMVWRELMQACGSACYVRSQAPLVCGDDSEPEPDASVVEGMINDYINEHPKTAPFVVEVSDSTLAFDRGAKASLYATAGVPEYWIVNLVDSVVEVLSEPIEVEGEPGRRAYQRRRVAVRGESLLPVAGAAPVAVESLLP